MTPTNARPSIPSPTQPTSLTCLNPETGLRPANMQNRLQITFGTRLINQDVPQEVVRRILDHDSPQMTAHYAVCQKLHQMGDLNGFFRELVA